VARLTLPDIEKFVHNWYQTHIDNDQEQTFHAGDLIRILHNQDSRAIRDRPSHRINAVLPDERVVRYQKCTETLLNIWHVWKFKTEYQKRREKVERATRYA